MPVEHGGEQFALMRTPTGIRIVHLFELPQHISTVARWIHDEFWAGKDRYTPDMLEALLREATSAAFIPISLLALRGEEPIGTVNLIESDDDQRPHLRPWLAALFVLPEHRHHGIGSMLVRTLQEKSAQLEIGSMYLGTDNAGFYRRLGATFHEQLSTDFCIMRLECSRKQVFLGSALTEQN